MRETRFIGAGISILLACLSLSAAHAETCGQWQRIRFSLDGKYLMAHNNCEIQVFAADPPAIRLHLRTDQATDVAFSPDSHELVFLNNIQEVERWSIAENRQLSIKQAPACQLRALSPDGRLLACVNEGRLTINDVEAADRVLEVTKFSLPFMSGPPLIDFDPLNPEPNELLPPTTRTLEFSPDGRFLLAWPMGKGKTVLWQVRDRQALPLKGALSVLGRLSFYNLKDAIFLADGRVAMSYDYCYAGLRRSCSTRVVSMPDGRWINMMKLPTGRLADTSDPNVVIVETPAVGSGRRRTPTRTIAFDIRTGAGLRADRGLMDVHGDYSVVQVSPDVIEVRNRNGKDSSRIVMERWRGAPR